MQVARMKKKVVAVGIFLLFSFSSACLYWQLPPDALFSQGARSLASLVLGYVYVSDTNKPASRVESYRHALVLHVDQTRQLAPAAGDKGNAAGCSLTLDGKMQPEEEIPFVYERMDAPYLVRLRQQYHFDDIISTGNSEFEAMLALASWVGTRWDHGTGKLPVEGRYDPAAVLKKAASGTPYWCEVAAILMVQAATSMGWPARLVTASRNGYRWEHALAELWSNQYDKWVLLDVDYNIYYAAGGKPLSAWELCHKGLALKVSGQLKVHRFAPLKSGLVMQDLLPYYAYVHIDLRNDWYSRRLRRGSPAGGDLATWWTARPELGRILTAKRRVDSQVLFDWPLNHVEVSCEPGHNKGVQSASSSGSWDLFLGTYSPYFDFFQFSYDDENWVAVPEEFSQTRLASGDHCLKVRIATRSGWSGPVRTLCYSLNPAD